MILRNNLITNLGYGWKDVRHWLRFLLKQKRWCFQLTAWSLTNGRLSQSELRAAWLLWASQFSAGPARSLILMHNLITGSRGIQGTNNDIILIDRVIRLYVCTESGMDGGHLIIWQYHLILIILSLHEANFDGSQSDLMICQFCQEWKYLS